ncbi:MAG TPA: aminopeptidase P family protein, partial [Vicinamibacteria bacterium]|nr:aminopeptidase P family protein [Vicinamibacteria bacterium]
MKARPAPAARLMYAAPETDADMLYATRFFAPDPFLFVQARGRRLVVMGDLEIDRAKKQLRVDRVLSWTRLADEVKRGGA